MKFASMLNRLRNTQGAALSRSKAIQLVSNFNGYLADLRQ